jgi:hypothetical protein
MSQNFGKKGKVQRKEHVENTAENEIKESKQRSHIGIWEQKRITI